LRERKPTCFQPLISRVVGDADNFYTRIDLPDGPLRLDVRGGSALANDSDIFVQLRGGPDSAFQMASLHRVCALLANKRPPRSPDPRLPLLVRALQALDARRDGASLRLIGQYVLDGCEWPGRGDSVKSRARRLVALAARLKKAGAYGVMRRLI
jgi:hypothetical protein